MSGFARFIVKLHAFLVAVSLSALVSFTSIDYAQAMNNQFIVGPDEPLPIWPDEPLPELGIPSIPSQPSATVSNNNIITLQWTNSSSAASYSVHASINSGTFGYVSSESAGASQPSVAYSGLEAGSFIYKVQACNIYGCSQFSPVSNAVQITETASPANDIPPTDSSGFPSPPSLSASSVSVGAINGNFNVNSGIASWSTDIEVPKGIGGLTHGRNKQASG